MLVTQNLGLFDINAPKVGAVSVLDAGAGNLIASAVAGAIAWRGQSHGGGNGGCNVIGLVGIKDSLIVS
jgi:hypothetical protein